MSSIFAANLYGNAALMFDPNGTFTTAQPTGPDLVKWCMGNSLGLLLVNGSNLGFPHVKGYGDFITQNAGANRGSHLIQVVPCRVGPRFAFVPFAWNYSTTQ